MRVLYGFESQSIDVEGDFCFWPNPHASMIRTNSKGQKGIFRCIICRSTEFSSSCTQEQTKCKYCGLRGICTPDCKGIMSILESDRVYLAGVVDSSNSIN